MNVRAGRKRPGLMRQHLTAVQAAATVGQARVTGADVGSRELTFEPVAPLDGTSRINSSCRWLSAAEARSAA